MYATFRTPTNQWVVAFIINRFEAIPSALPDTRQLALLETARLNGIAQPLTETATLTDDLLRSLPIYVPLR